MKALKSLVLVAVIFSGFISEATSVRMQATYSAKIAKPNFTKNARYSSFERVAHGFIGGNIVLRVNLRDKEDNFLSVAAYQRTRCIEQRCFGMPAPVIVKVPYQKMEIDACGARVYSGVLDEREVGGHRTEITLVDNSTNKCRYLIAIPSTEITVKEKFLPLAGSNRSYEAITEFAGQKLEITE